MTGVEQELLVAIRTLKDVCVATVNREREVSRSFQEALQGVTKDMNRYFADWQQAVAQVSDLQARLGMVDKVDKVDEVDRPGPDVVAPLPSFEVLYQVFQRAKVGQLPNFGPRSFNHLTLEGRAAWKASLQAVVDALGVESLRRTVSTLRGRVARAEAELASLQAAAATEARPVKVRFNAPVEDLVSMASEHSGWHFHDENHASEYTESVMVLLQDHAVIDVPPGVPNVEELARRAHATMLEKYPSDYWIPYDECDSKITRSRERFTVAVRDVILSAMPQPREWSEEDVEALALRENATLELQRDGARREKESLEKQVADLRVRHDAEKDALRGNHENEIQGVRALLASAEWREREQRLLVEALAADMDLAAYQALEVHIRGLMTDAPGGALGVSTGTRLARAQGRLERERRILRKFKARLRLTAREGAEAQSVEGVAS